MLLLILNALRYMYLDINTVKNVCMQICITENMLIIIKTLSNQINIINIYKISNYLLHTPAF